MTELGYTAGEPIAAIATALSPAAIGIVRTSGDGCVALLANVFSRPDALLQAGGNTLVYGWIVERDKDGKVSRRIDEVMLGVYRKPRSFTGEEMVEIYCHGGIAVVKAVSALLLQSGFRQAERGEFTFRAFVNGKADLTKAEAVKEIIDSRTDSSRGRAAGRLAGLLHDKIDGIKQEVTALLASIEVAVEYPEDEETIADSFDIEELKRLSGEIGLLLSGWKTERLYQEGAKIVLAGRTNAGKSSLFNALLKEDRSIVSDLEGTTRDYLENMASFDGIPVRIFDTAGLRQTDDPVEDEGVSRSVSLAQEADILLYLVDSGRGICAQDRDFLLSYGASGATRLSGDAAPTPATGADVPNRAAPVVLVWNKCDKEGSLPLPSGEGENWDIAVCISAKNGQGLGDLVAAVKALLTQAAGVDSPVALGSERQRDALAESWERLEHAIRVAQDGELGLDAVVQDLEDALDFLGEITGEVRSTDVLESIFSSFCVGK
ncbi:MAG: tRNA uridine-5-carboxymethylaminomethyl(34) synthesis GTPase MnmE [Treponema sp.]|nr:tRNA uridine-5-carboxymethylaminomethyl(34) synthesis GTPase MnmE [Treponema sp.]